MQEGQTSLIVATADTWNSNKKWSQKILLCMFVIVSMIEQSLNNKPDACEKSEWTISYPVEIHI